MENPYSPPRANISVAASRHYGGLRRGPYFAISIGLAILQQILLAILAPSGAFNAPSITILALFTIAGFVIAYYRLLNIGMDPWWCLGLIVPILNIFIGVRCLAFQEGWADTRRLDTVGRIVVGLFLLLLALLLGGLILIIVNA